MAEEMTQSPDLLQGAFTVEEAATWARLQKKAPMNFAQETPLEDFLKYFHSAAANKDDTDGLMIYVNPVGLQEAEKTMASPLTLNLANVRLEKAAFGFGARSGSTSRSVSDPDGLLMIDFKASKNADRDDVNAMILDKLDAIEKQVAKLPLASRRNGRRHGGIGAGPGLGPRAEMSPRNLARIRDCRRPTSLICRRE